MRGPHVEYLLVQSRTSEAVKHPEFSDCGNNDWDGVVDFTQVGVGVAAFLLNAMQGCCDRVAAVEEDR